MSLPREIREELLSAYLDDALRGDERTRVERMLATDEDARSLLEEMRSIQSSTKAAMRSDSRLTDGFSERVIAAAIDRAQQEQLPAQHHVRLAASRSGETKTAAPASIQPPYRRLGVVLALAASLLFVVTLWNSFPGQDGSREVANLQDGRANVDSAITSKEIPSGDVDSEPVDEPNGKNETASDVASIAERDPMAAEISREEFFETDIDTDERPMPEALATAESNRQAMESEKPARERRSLAPETDRAEGDSAAMLAMRAVMMFEVEQTDLGRENNVVLQMMRQAGIQANLKQRVNDAVVGYLREARLIGDPSDASSDADASSQVSVVYVEASGKELDRFMLSLVGDTEQIARIGWNMAMDAPVVDAAAQMEKILATDVRHAEDSAAAWQLVTEDAQQGFMAPGAGREFFPIDRADPAGWEAVGSVNSGPDIRSRLLILIR